MALTQTPLKNAALVKPAVISGESMNRSVCTLTDKNKKKKFKTTTAKKIINQKLKKTNDCKRQMTKTTTTEKDNGRN